MLTIRFRVAALRAAALAREDGQGLAEYAMVLALIAVVAIAGLTMLGANLATSFTGIGTSVSHVIH